MKKNQLFLFAMILGSCMALNTDVQCDSDDYVGEFAIVNDSAQNLHIKVPTIGSEKLDEDLVVRAIGNFDRTSKLQKSETFKDRLVLPAHSVLMFPVTNENVSDGGLFTFDALTDSSKSISLSKNIKDLKQEEGYAGLFLIDRNQNIRALDIKEFENYFN